jgi:hypothetical protein
MSPGPPAHFLLLGKLQKKLVDQGRGLKGMVLTLVAHSILRYPFKLRIHEFHQLRPHLKVSASAFAQKHSNLTHVLIRRGTRFHFQIP